MKITSVRFRKLISLPGYENKAVEAEASIDDGETPEDALLALVDWVNVQLRGGATTPIEELRQEVNFLHSQRQQLRGAVSGAEAEKRKLQDEVHQLEIRREKAGGEPVVPF